ncbi:phospholipid-translocating P-type ATPase, flippase family protein [Tritrichomonas foetus]|uniref:Phospholipid-transporting ATPase n=1 Tax=Tritrichomonas foetus TaxID=1144522 RepID=A0A1J4KBC0_9EUKA|nr:phospholipid-translocating P-type ATPase, flippase family protein [Tritrichomonas foetus]|eukprot:OHT08713.1 phospholipid-translocating P-type ATPase, flippase family protein [Tritrichomonas foetus]
MSGAEEKGRSVVIHMTRNAKGKKLFMDNGISTTKYNVLTFLPKNLFEQFSRIANFYFLVTACLMFFPWSPLESTTALLPLAIVVLISMVREGIEDFMRYLSDRKVNATKVDHLDGNTFKDIEWRKVLVGDVLLIKKNEQIPADVVLLNTSEPEGIAYVDTCNLDGETNLKVRQALPQTKSVVDAVTAAQFQSTIVCDSPNNFLYTFNGYMTIVEKNCSLTNDQVILRGCVLRNTAWAIGVVVYTGLETKLMMNSSAARSKRSSLERGLNLKLISVFAFMIVLGIISASIGVAREKDLVNTGKSWYLYQGKTRSAASAFFILMFSYILLMNAMIPISLYVTLEVVRVFQALFIAWDKGMYHIETKTSASARTSNLSEDLGQIDYVFSDKTGTLTRNVMEFMKCSIGGEKYGKGITEVAYAAAKRRGIACQPPDNVGKAFKDERFMQLLKKDTPPIVRHFMWMLSVCHSVIPEEDSTKPYGIAFQASSPDEGALVGAAADFDYIFKQRGPGYVVVGHKGEDVRIEVLQTIEFTSDRKRSSVILRSPDTGEIVMYTKGADDCIMERLAEGAEFRAITMQHLRDFAADGLRTLCCAYKIIDEGFYNSWAARFNEANCLIEGREQAVAEIADEIERDLHLLGATAIEDKLQIGVPDAIEAILQAGINVWIITGDKRETAINIGFACSLLASDMTLIVLDSSDPAEIQRTIHQGLGRPGKLALIASGAALYYAMDEDNKDTFFALTERCQSVICCRVSPLQKAKIVELVRKKTGKLTLAIGDGANDVGMILKADIGVGISGQEGRQAVMASDYAFGQFRFLKRLLVYHGRLNLMRNVELINYSFYKNMVYTLNQFIFGFFCNFSAMTLFDGFLYSIFNVVFTSCPPVVYAGMERDISERRLMAFPELYKWDGNRKWMISYGNFWLSLSIGILHCLISFLVPYFGMAPYVDGNGQSIGYGGFGITVYGCVVAIVTTRIAMMTTYWTWIAHVFIWGSACLYPLAVLILDYSGLGKEIQGLSVPTLGSIQFWISIIGSVVLANLPVIAFKTVMNSLNLMTNKVMLIERTKVKAKEARRQFELKNIETEEQQIIGRYVDEKNETGYNFDPPVSMYRIQRFEQPSETTYYTADAIRERIRPRMVSTFGLDQL